MNFYGLTVVRMIGARPPFTTVDRLPGARRLIGCDETAGRNWFLLECGGETSITRVARSGGIVWPKERTYAKFLPVASEDFWGIKSLENLFENLVICFFR